MNILVTHSKTCKNTHIYWCIIYSNTRGSYLALESKVTLSCYQMASVGGRFTRLHYCRECTLIYIKVTTFRLTNHLIILKAVLIDFFDHLAAVEQAIYLLLA